MSLEFKIDLNKIRKNKVMVCCPMYGGMANGLFVKSCIDLQSYFQNHGIILQFSFLFNESLITRARNYLADEFLRSDCTHLLFIDSDIEFNSEDVLTMLHLDKEIICGPYPKKSINFNAIKNAVLKNNDIPTSELEKLVGEYVWNPIPGTNQMKIDNPIEVMESGTGFMLIKREVFNKFKEEYPHQEYTPDHIGQQHFDGKRKIHAYFDTDIDPISNRYRSEDYYFCQMCRAVGIKVWLCPWMKLSHQGTFSFKGDMSAIASHLGTL